MENNITASTTITTEPEKPEDCLVGTLCMGNYYVPNSYISCRWLEWLRAFDLEFSLQGLGFRVVMSVYRLDKIWNSPQFPAKFRNIFTVNFAHLHNNKLPHENARQFRAIL